VAFVEGAAFSTAAAAALVGAASTVAFWVGRFLHRGLGVSGYLTRGPLRRHKRPLGGGVIFTAARLASGGFHGGGFPPTW